MAAQLLTPGEKSIKSTEHIGDEIKALLEAISLIDAGALPIEILKQIA